MWYNKFTQEGEALRMQRRERRFYVTNTSPRILAAHWLDAIVTDNGGLVNQHPAFHYNARTWLTSARLNRQKMQPA